MKIEYMYPCTYAHREGGRGVDEPVKRLEGRYQGGYKEMSFILAD
jgi:hypothetical protein